MADGGEGWLFDKMATEKNNKDSVIEKGSHRLLRVLMYASTCIVIVFAGIGSANDSANYTYSYAYSFEPTYERDEGTEQSCSYSESRHDLYCGGLNRLSDLMDRYEAVKGSTGGASDSAPWEKIRSRHDSASIRSKKQFREVWYAWGTVEQALITDLDSDRIRFRQAKHWKAGALAESLGLTLSITTLWYAFTLTIYKGIFIIACGHTRILRA